MEWEEFLKHPKVIFDTKHYLREPPGEYLYKKMLHDMLECLNGYKGFIEIVSSMQDIPDNTRQWLAKWNPLIETWVSDLTMLSKYYYQQKTPHGNMDWPSLIARLGNIPIEAPLQYTEAQTLILPSEELSRDLIKRAIASIARLNLICHHIQNQAYVDLWTMEDKPCK